jgi:hypothetical protein
MKKLTILTAILMLVTASAMSSTLSKVTVMGKPYYKYQVKKGDTMYGVARQFGWDEKIIQQSNPGEMTTLQKGSMLYYPCDSEEAVQKEDSNNNTSTAGKDGVTHRIERGETLSSIARMYGMTAKELQMLNPGAGDYIKAGDLLVISDPKTTSTGGNSDVSYHKIQAGETLYGIGKKYNVSVEALLKSNPGVSERNFRAGETIRIPASGTGIVMTTETVREDVLKGFREHKVKKEETWNSIARKYGIPADVLREANSGVELKKNIYIGIPVIESEEVSRQVVDEDKREIQEIYQDINGINDSTGYNGIRFAVVSGSQTSRRDREIMRGVLMAVDKLKNSGSKITLKMLEGNNSESVLGELDTFNPTIVMSTAETDFPEWLAKYGNDSRVPVINTLDVKNVDFQSNPYMVQLITTPDYFNEEVANWIFQKYGSYSLVFTGEKDPNDALAESLQSIWDPSRVRSRSVEDLRSLPLNAQGKYLLYSFPTKKADVVEFLDAVNDAKTKTPEADVTVIGRPNWIVYDEALSEKFHNADVQIPARFYMSKSERNNSEFSLHYRQLFNAAVPNTFPVYSGIGYDTALYFLQGLSDSKGDINAMGRPDGMVQSEFELERPSNWSGIMNRAVFMVRFTPYDSIEKTVVK